MTTKPNPFTRLGLPESPVFLAPLAGVSDHPFRRVCTGLGADLTYVEMLSATALLFDSPRTWSMMKRHESEKILGVQITGRSADELARAVSVLDKQNFETIDLNMGCPVSKVVKSGCGSSLIKDPENVFRIVKAVRQSTDKPLSVKIRLGWDKQTITGLAVADAVEKAGADWLTVHGRLRNDDYSAPVDLESIAAIKRSISIPVIGNGNIFSRADAIFMKERTNVDGVMVSRGALGNPWAFREIATGQSEVQLDEWLAAVRNHLTWQQEEYGDQGGGAVCMRKHLLWYVKGWPGARKVREQMTQVSSLTGALDLIEQLAEHLREEHCSIRQETVLETGASRFQFDPKWDMDRSLDRGVGDDHMSVIQ